MRGLMLAIVLGVISATGLAGGQAPAPATVPSTQPATQPAPVSASERDALVKLAGQDAVVIGAVAAIKDLSPRVLAIKFKGNNRDGFVGVTFADKDPSAHAFFESEAGKKLIGQHVQVSGKVSLYKGNPEIIISDPAQVQITPAAQ